MKYLKKILFVLILFVMFIPFVYADNIDRDKNLVNIYLFYSDSCIHCASEKELLSEIVDNYDNVRVYKYEVSNNEENKDLMFEVADLMDVTVSGVPFTVIADKPYKGFDRNTSKRIFIGTIEYYSNHGYRDIVGEYFGNIELPNYELVDTSDFYNYIDNYGNYKISFLGFDMDTMDLSIPILSMIVGIVDGVNLSGIFILIFIISLLINIDNKRKKMLLGIFFIGIFILIDLLFINVNIDFNGIKNILGILIIVISLLYGIFRNKRKCLLDSIKDDSLYRKNLFLIISGVIILCVFINIVESLSNTYFSIFLDVVSINNLNVYEKIIYIMMYVLFFELDNLVIFFIMMSVIQNNNFAMKYGKIIKIITSLLLFITGLILIFR